MLLTKLHIPDSDKNSIKRYHLFEKLNDGLNRKLILVSAPAGFGKSTIISDWINTNKIPTAWFSIDNNDNDIVDFLNYVISSIQAIKKDFGQSSLKLLNSPNQINPISIANLIINDILEIKDDFLLVLDDFHLIDNKEIFNLISHLLEHIPENIHIVISTRSDPNLSLARLRSQNQVVELRASDLSFSLKDTSTLFNKKYSLNLSSEDIYELQSKTEGWIAGIQLTALSMQKHENISQFIQSLKGDNRYIMDYLIEEVLKVQSGDVKDFLLQTSILNQFSAPLCNVVLNRNDSQEIIEKLESNNMFIFPLDNERKWYRYHHLFAQLLQQKLLNSSSISLESVHNKAIDWYESHEMYELALEHAITIKNYNKCIHILENTVEKMWKKGLHDAIKKYGSLIPDEYIKKSPNFCLFYSWIMIAAGETKKVNSFLQSAEEITRNNINNKNSKNEVIEYNTKLLGKISIAFAFLYSYTGNTSDIFDYCEFAVTNVTPEDNFWYSWAWFSYGIAYYSIAELEKSLDALNKAYEYGKKSGDIYQISTIIIRLADNEQQLGYYKSAYKKCTDLLELLKTEGYSQITKENWAYAALYNVMGASHFIWGDLDDALKYIQIAFDLRKNVKDAFLKSYILIIYLFLQTECGVDDTKEIENEFIEMIQELNVSYLLTPFYIGWKLYGFIKNNQFDKADKIIEEYGISPSDKVDYYNKMAYSMYARLLLQQNKLKDAETLISNITKVSGSNMVELNLDIKVLNTILYKKTDRRELALKSLMEALEIASAENLISFFLTSIDQIDDLLDEIYRTHPTSNTNIPKDFIDNLKLSIKKYGKIKKEVNEFELSSRELETLKLIAQNLSNQEIANELYISITTVKTHVRNILSKLGAKNRIEAGIIAKEKSII